MLLCHSNLMIPKPISKLFLMLVWKSPVKSKHLTGDSFEKLYNFFKFKYWESRLFVTLMKKIKQKKGVCILVLVILFLFYIIWWYFFSQARIITFAIAPLGGTNKLFGSWFLAKRRLGCSSTNLTAFWSSCGENQRTASISWEHGEGS